jgi:hypothetical protein
MISNQNKFTSCVERTKILVALPKFLQSFSFIITQENGSWRNTCSKTYEPKNGRWNKKRERERERESGKSSSITIAHDMVSWE